MSEREIFSAAVSLTDPARREVFLRQACAGRDNLRRRVDALLRAHDEASAFLGTPAIEQALGTTAPNVSGTPPQVGENFFEVYNGSPSVANHGDHIHVSTDRLWDIVLTFRIADLGMPLMYGLACDDSHDYHQIPSRDANPGRGWVQVLATELTPEALIASLEAGRFYASSGVRIEAVESKDDSMSVTVAAEPGVDYTIEFIGTRAGFDATSAEVVNKDGRPVRTTRRYSEDVGAVLKTVKDASATYQFRGDELYVRCRVTSSKLHPDPSEPGEFERAWCQPVRGAAGMLE